MHLTTFKHYTYIYRGCKWELLLLARCVYSCQWGVEAHLLQINTPVSCSPNNNNIDRSSRFISAILRTSEKTWQHNERVVGLL